MDFYNSTVDFNELRYESHRNLFERMAIEFEHGDKIDELVEEVNILNTFEQNRVLWSTKL